MELNNAAAAAAEAVGAADPPADTCGAAEGAESHQKSVLHFAFAADCA